MHKKPKKLKFHKASNTQKTTPNIVEGAILDVLAYRSVFNYPVSIFHLYAFCNKKISIDLLSLYSALNKLVERGEVKTSKGRYILKGIKECDWKDRYQISQKFIDIARKDSKLLSNIPWVKLICITGSVSAFNAQEDSDIDLLIVTKQNRVWITRLYVFLILKLMNRLRTDKNVSQKICPNIILGEDKMLWSIQKRNLYTANEACMMIPVYDSSSYYFKFFASNTWVFDNFPNFGVCRESLEKEHSHNTKVKKRVGVREGVIDLIDSLSMKMQLAYMKPKITSEVLLKDFIHLNKNDSQRVILTNLQKIRTKHIDN